MPLHQIRFQADGAELFGYTTGHGEPVLIVHGGPGLGSEYLRSWFIPLSKQHKIFFYDQRGAGHSAASLTDENINFTNYLADLAAVCDQISPEPIRIIGHSFGALLAARFAAAYPSRVKSLILVSSFPVTGADYALFDAEVQRRCNGWRPDIEQLAALPAFKEGQAEALENYYRLVFKAYFAPGTDFSSLIISSPPGVGIKQLHAIRPIFYRHFFGTPFDVSEEMRRIKAPTVLIHGDLSPVAIVEVEGLQRLIAGSRLVVLPGRGHFPWLEDADEFLEVLSGVLAASAPQK